MRNGKPRPDRMDYSPADFDNGTVYFSTLEAGQYIRLLNHAWKDDHGCTLPNDAAKLAAIARVEAVSPAVMGKFKENEDGRLYNERQLREWLAAVSRMEQRHDIATAGGRARQANRKQGGSSAEAEPTVSQNEPTLPLPIAEPKPTGIDGEMEGASLPPDSQGVAKQVLGYPAEISAFCKSFYSLLYPDKNPGRYPGDWMETLSQLVAWVKSQGDANPLPELMEMANWAIRDSGIQESGFSWTEQVSDMEKFAKFVRKGTLPKSFFAWKRKQEAKSKPDGQQAKKARFA